MVRMYPPNDYPRYQRGKTQDQNGAGKVQEPEGRNGKGSKIIREEMALKNKDPRWIASNRPQGKTRSNLSVQQMGNE